MGKKSGDAPLQTNKLRVLVMISGSGSNLQAIIDEVKNNQLDIELCAVVSDQTEAFGLDRAQQAKIPAIAVDYSAFESREDAEQSLASILDRLDPDLVVLAGFMRLLPASLVDRFAGKMLNIHPSLLPKFRGLNTYKRVLAAGDDWHGSTVHYVTPTLDSGPSIVQYRVRVREADTEDSLAQRVRQGEYIIYPTAIRWFAEGRLRLTDAGVELDGQLLDGPAQVEEEKT